MCHKIGKGEGEWVIELDIHKWSISSIRNLIEKVSVVKVVNVVK